MSIINIVSKVKQIHPDTVVLVKVGTFYNAYGKDAYIISNLFKYKIQEIENVPFSGFNIKVKPRIIAALDEQKINYIVLDKRNNYDVDEKVDFKNLNKYEERYYKSRKEVNKQLRIEKIYKMLQENSNKEEIYSILAKVEEVLNERRKV